MRLDRIQDVKVPIKVVLGETERSLQDIAGITEGTIIELDSLAGEPVDVVAAGEVIAKAEVVVIDENFGVRIVKIVDKEEVK